MSNPAGWYPQPDGQQRYWDGQQWTEDFAPGVPPGTPPANAPQTPPAVSRKNWFLRHKILTAIGAVVLIAVVASIASGGGTKSGTSTTSPGATSTANTSSGATSAAKPAAPVSQLGKKVLDGKFAFTVTGVKCGIAEVGTAGLSQKAQGEFCKVSVTVENTGKEAQPMSDTDQYAFDAKGRKFTADSTAGVYDPSTQLLFQPINPGNMIKGNIYYDVPKGTKIVKLELHDSPFSNGVTVTL